MNISSELYEAIVAQLGTIAAENARLRSDLATAKAIIRILMQAADRAGFGISIPPTPDTAPMLVMLDELGCQSPFTKVEKL